MAQFPAVGGTGSETWARGLNGALPYFEGHQGWRDEPVDFPQRRESTGRAHLLSQPVPHQESCVCGDAGWRQV